MGTVDIKQWLVLEEKRDVLLIKDIVLLIFSKPLIVIL